MSNRGSRWALTGSKRDLRLQRKAKEKTGPDGFNLNPSQLPALSQQISTNKSRHSLRA
jgi:hypothetical protein